MIFNPASARVGVHTRRIFNYTTLLQLLSSEKYIKNCTKINPKICAICLLHFLLRVVYYNQRKGKEMIIKVSGVNNTRFYNEQREQKTKYYFPQTSKDTVKKDFGIMLDTEMKKLHFNKLV